MRRVAIAVIVCLLGLILVACSQDSPPVGDSGSPEAVTREYFEALSQGDSQRARELEWANGEDHESLYDERELLGLTELEVGESVPDTTTGRPAEFQRFTEIAVVPVSFMRGRSSSIGEPPPVRTPASP
jgi:hypothetical protein